MIENIAKFTAICALSYQFYGSFIEKDPKVSRQLIKAAAFCWLSFAILALAIP